MGGNKSIGNGNRKSRVFRRQSESSFLSKETLGEPDEWGIKEFYYKFIETLPAFSELPTPVDSRDNYWSEEIFIQNSNRTLVLVFNSYPKKSMGPN